MKRKQSRPEIINLFYTKRNRKALNWDEKSTIQSSL